MTLQEAFDGLNRQQRRTLEKLVKKGYDVESALNKVLMDTNNNLPTSNSTKKSYEHPVGQKNRTTFIRKSS